MARVRVFGLSRLDSLDLKRQYPDAEITFDAATPQEAEHGELATAALIVLSLAGIKALAAWLLKNSMRGKIKRTIDVIEADGSRRTEVFEMQLSESTSQGDVVKALAEVMKIDPNLPGV